MLRASAAALVLAFTLCLTAAAQTPPALTIVRVGGIMSGEMTPVVVAQRAGTYAKSGLDVRVVEATSGAATAAAVLAGAVEVGKSSLLALMNAHLRGIPLAVIMGSGVYDAKAPYAELVVAADAQLRTGKDLNGKIVGVPSVNDLSQLCTAAWVDQNGGDSKTLKFVELPNPSLPAALAEHRIDAAIVSYPALADGLESGKIKVLGHAFNTIAPVYMNTAWFVSADWAGKHADAIKAFVRVTAEAAAYANAHPAEMAATTAELTKVPLAVVQRMPTSMPERH